MARITCYRCFWPQSVCWCGTITPMATRTRFVFLMHPKEFKQEKAATGRLTHLCLPNSVIHCGIEFDGHDAVQELIADPNNFPVLLYPGRDAFNFSDAPIESITAFDKRVGNRQLVVLLLDATWALARKMLKLSPSLQRLPRVMFTPTAPSRYVIKQQPHPACLSTLEATHELLTALEQSGRERGTSTTQLLELFERMQNYQIRCASDPSRASYRNSGGYSAPAERRPLQGRSGRRRANVFQAPVSAPSE
jgi:DTW domain-containing protein YfiP